MIHWFIFDFAGTSTGTTSTSTIQFSHNNSSNNNNMNSSNLNLTATHNGFGLNHNTINQTHQNHLNSSSVLTYRSNRRSMDRSDNKISDTISSTTSSSIRNTLFSNDPIHEGLSNPSSYFNICLRFIYKMLMFINNGFSKRKASALNNTNSKLSDSLFIRILSILKYKLAGGEGNNFNKILSHDSGIEQSNYIERIDDEHTENSDLSVNATVTKVASSSLASSSPTAVELPTGKIRHKFTT